MQRHRLYLRSLVHLEIDVQTQALDSNRRTASCMQDARPMPMTVRPLMLISQRKILCMLAPCHCIYNTRSQCFTASRHHYRSPPGHTIAFHTTGHRVTLYRDKTEERFNLERTTVPAIGLFGYDKCLISAESSRWRPDGGSFGAIRTMCEQGVSASPARNATVLGPTVCSCGATRNPTEEALSGLSI